MRYSIMLQVVGIITLILVGTAALFAWLQNREISPSSGVSRGERPFARTSDE